MLDTNHRRSNVQLIADILRMGGGGKPEIMYSATMSYRQLQKYLAFLVQEGFLEQRMVKQQANQRVLKG